MSSNVWQNLNWLLWRIIPWLSVGRSPNGEYGQFDDMRQTADPEDNLPLDDQRLLSTNNNNNKKNDENWWTYRRNLRFAPSKYLHSVLESQWQ